MSYALFDNTNNSAACSMNLQQLWPFLINLCIQVIVCNRVIFYNHILHSCQDLHSGQMLHSSQISRLGQILHSGHYLKADLIQMIYVVAC